MTLTPSDARSAGRRRVIFVNRFGPPDLSATAQILTDLARHLASAGYAVEVIASRRRYDQPAAALLPHDEESDGVRMIRVWTPHAPQLGIAGRVIAYLAFYLAAFVAILRRCDRDTILIVKTDPPLIALPAMLAARLRGAAVIHWVQDLYPEIADAYGMAVGRGPIGAMLRAARNVAYARATRIVAIGVLMAKRIAATGIDPARIAIIGNWSDDEAIVPSPVRSPRLRAGGISRPMRSSSNIPAIWGSRMNSRPSWARRSSCVTGPISCS